MDRVKEGGKMPKLQGVEQYNAKKENSIKGYRIALSKTGIDKTGFKVNDDLDVEYKTGKIIITKKEN